MSTFFNTCVSSVSSVTITNAKMTYAYVLGCSWFQHCCMTSRSWILDLYRVWLMMGYLVSCYLVCFGLTSGCHWMGKNEYEGHGKL